MDLTEKHWFKKYVEIRMNREIPRFIDDDDVERQLYNLFQPTGIMYGHPLNLPDYMEMSLEDWPVKERIKIIFAECILSVYESHHGEPLSLENISNLKELLEKLMEHTKSPFQWFGNKKDEIDAIEQLLESRVIVKAQWNKNFWQGFFHNIMLFGDIIILFEKLTKPEIDAIQAIDELRTQALKTIIRSAQANGEIDNNEEKLFTFFLESCGFKRKEYNNWHHKLHHFKSQQSEPIINPQTSWIRKKYLLNLALLSSWADRNLDKMEEEFLTSFCTDLGLEQEELFSTEAAIEGFVMNNWKRVHYLSSKQNYYLVSQRLLERMKKIALKYKHEIQNEIVESKELMQLIEKSSKGNPLTLQEREIVRNQLIDVLKSIPAFVIIALPFSFLTLPVLFKILPKSFFPSSFDENKMMKGKGKYFTSG